jgi:hypothetical protein
LLRLGLGHDLTHVLRGGGKYLIASPDEVLKLKPELQPATWDRHAPEADQVPPLRDAERGLAARR